MENVLIGGFNRKEVERDLEFIGRKFEGDIVWATNGVDITTENRRKC